MKICTFAPSLFLCSVLPACSGGGSGDSSVPDAVIPPGSALDVYSIESYESRTVSNTSLTGTWMVIVDSNYESTTIRGTAEGRSQVRFSLNLVDKLDGTVASFDCADDSTNRRTINVEDSELDLIQGGATVLLNVANNTRLEGRVVSFNPDRVIVSSSVTAVKIDDQSFEDDTFLLGTASINISNAGVNRTATMPIGCFEAGEREGTFNAEPFSTDSLLYHSFENLIADGQSHRAELLVTASGQDVSASFSDNGNSPSVKATFRVSGDGNAEDRIELFSNDAVGFSGEYSSNDEVNSSDNVSGSFDVSF